jgi:toxin ParE1/3/4
VKTFEREPDDEPFIVSPTARRDIADHAVFLIRETEDERIGDAFVDEFEEYFGLLASQPRMGRLRPELGHRLRCHVHDEHLVFYRIRSKRIRIARVLHHSRDVLKVFRKRKRKTSRKKKPAA